MSAHERFESLAGAVMLGEATPAERETFAAHAATCAACRADSADGALVMERIAVASGTERWRPAQPIVERMRARRSVRSRLTLGALGWGVALSLVINVAFVSGIGSRLGSAFMTVGDSQTSVASTRVALEGPARPRLAAPAVAMPSRTRVAIRAPRAPRHDTKPRVVAVAREKAVAASEPRLDDVPDPLAGIDLYGEGTPHRAVARVAIPHCLPHGDDAPEVRPCLDATGRIEH